MSDSYGPPDRRRPSGPWDHHAEARDQWADEPPGHRRPEPHGPLAEPPSWADEPTGYQTPNRHDPQPTGPDDRWGSDGLSIRRAGERPAGDPGAEDFRTAAADRPRSEPGPT
jgi:hypothetical protein